MEIKAKTRTEQILIVMHILAWVAFIGLLIKAGAIQISYIVSFVNAEAARNLYAGKDWYDLRQFNFWHYTLSVSFLVAITGLKAFVSFLVIQTLSKVSLTNPFTTVVVRLIERISYFLLGTWFLGTLSNVHNNWLLKITGAPQGDWISGEFIFMAGLVFILAQIFKRGVEIQSENELTV